MKVELKIEKLNGHDKEGQVGKLAVAIGDTVEIGSTLLTIESGKGSLPVKSKYAGQITALTVSEGDTVVKGQVIGAMESDGQSAPKKSGYSFGLAKPSKENVDVDLLIIGGGPGGYVAAIRGAQAGLKVAVIEAHRLGGTCLNYGCIPTKAMTASVDVLEKIRAAASHGIDADLLNIDLAKIVERKDGIVDQLVGGIEHLMAAHDILWINGKAEVADAKTIKVETKKAHYTCTFKSLVLAMGSEAALLPIEGATADTVLTSKELLTLTEIPKSLTIVGGGVIGMEFAFIYNALGTRVNVVEFAPQILGLVDADVAEVIRTAATEKGIGIYENTRAVAIQETLDGSKLLEVETDGEKSALCAEHIAMAVGRKAALNTLDLETLGVALNERQNGIEVDAYMRTNVENIYAIGDVTNRLQLAHVASHQGIVAVDHIVGKAHPMAYDTVPSAIFTSPEIGHVGQTEKDATGEVLVSKFPMMANGKALTMDAPEGFIKLIADAETRTLIGGTAVGAHATDLLAVLTNLIASKTTIDSAAEVIYAHPTTSEAVHEALLMLDGKGLHFA